MSVNATTTPAPDKVDARVPRFTATITAIVLGSVLALTRVDLRAATFLLAAQAVVFAIGAVRGPAGHPYAMTSRRFIAPRLGPVTKRDPVEQFRFAQMMGFVLCATGLGGFALGSHLVGTVAVGFALFAALMRAVFGICLSRGPYMLVCRMQGKVPACCQGK